MCWMKACIFIHLIKEERYIHLIPLLEHVEAFNIELGKWKWRFITEKERLWVRILESKCGRRGSGVNKVDKFNSLWWRHLQSIDKEEWRIRANWFDNNLIREVGNGVDTSFWEDPWLVGVVLRKFIQSCIG